MSNVYQNNNDNLKIRVNYDEYWDFILNKDDSLFRQSFDYSNVYEKCLISYIDTDIKECIDGNKLIGYNKYTWEHSSFFGGTLHNVGLTGMDNGLIPFRRDLENNRSFAEKYTKSKLVLDEKFITLNLHQVSGGTNNYEYPITVLDNLIKLNGGFYQGFFKTRCDEYQILPSNIEDVWHFEFVLNKEDFEKESNKTLNDKYPENKGIFFYIGTRAENKWAYLYNKDNDNCLMLGADDYVENGEISKEDYKITNMIDANPVFVDYEEFFYDDYLNFKYYSDELYNPREIDEDDFFFDDYIDVTSKPLIIDEKRNPSTQVRWSKYASSTIKPDRKNCGCAVDFDLTETMRHDGGFLSKCDLFGDDYILDIDSVEYGGDFIEVDLDLRDFDFETDKGVNIKVNNYYFETDNKFLLFDRTCSGFDIHNWKEGTLGVFVGKKSSFKGNLFLLMNRTCTGYTINDIEQLKEEYQQEYNIYEDIYNNALAFIIKDDGRIGYRYLVLDCENEEEPYKIEEGYSNEGIIKDKQWYTINVKINAIGKSMFIRFYVNGKLVFVSKELPKLKLRELHEMYDKQETVPFNISLGGGTQGLIETILPNYMLDPYRVYPLEKHFAGSFIGYFKSFKFYDCLVEYLNILHNFMYETNKLKIYET